MLIPLSKIARIRREKFPRTPLEGLSPENHLHHLNSKGKTLASLKRGRRNEEGRKLSMQLEPNTLLSFHPPCGILYTLFHSHSRFFVSDHFFSHPQVSINNLSPAPAFRTLNSSSPLTPRGSRNSSPMSGLCP